MTNSSKVFLVFLILVIGGGYYAFQQWNPGNEQAEVTLAEGPVAVEIPEGTGARGVAQILEDNRVITSASAFTAAASIDGRAGQIKPGAYELDPQSTTEELLDVLVAGPPAAETYTVTVPEGLTVEQTLARIAETEGSPFTVEQLREALMLVALPAWVPPDRELPEGAEAFEGLLWPETYEFTVNQPPEEVLTRLVTQTDAVVSEVGFAERNGLTTYETLVLASLVEREARLAEERPIISSVIHNRLEDEFPLQIDATVVYGMTVAGQPPEDGRLFNEDYQFDSPWSTYVYPGLPPTPISGVGRSALEAAANPDDTEFYYYVVENPETGAHRFSETLAQHEQAIAEIRGG